MVVSTPILMNGRLDVDFNFNSCGFKSNQTPTRAQSEPVASIVMVSPPDPYLYFPKRFDFVGACCGCG
jgi:hypothetical protein